MQKFLVVDFETTGSKVQEGDQIFQIGAVLIEEGQIVSQFSSFVNPETRIPPFIQQLTQIDDTMVQDAPSIEEAITGLLPLLDGAVFVAHNVHFDLGFLQAALSEAGYLPFAGPIIDTVELSRLLLPNQGGYRLSELSASLGVEHDAPHQADSDAMATAHIFLDLIEKLYELPLLVIQRLAALTSEFGSDIDVLIEWIEQDRIRTGKHGDEDESLEMYRQIALKQKKEFKPVDWGPSDPEFSSFVSDLYVQMEEKMDAFEPRPAQQEMMERIHSSFSNGQNLLAEAGTGTGKSLAYLVPALFWAHETGEKVIVSTHTIQLQEQLYTRDLPLLSEMLSIPFDAAIFKGRNNYLCLRKFELSLLDQGDNHDLQLSKGQILTWLTETETGDAEELNLPSGGRVYWRQIQSDTHSCLHKQCPWFTRCFYYAARKKAAEAEIIITNHSLLFTDVKAEQRILPAYDYAIIDEAHQFEEAASSHLGLSFHSMEMDATLLEMTSDKGTGIIDRITQDCVSLPLWDHIGAEVESALQMVTELKEYAKDLFQQLYLWGNSTRNGKVESGRITKRYRPGQWETREQVTEALNYTEEWLRLLQTSLEKVYVHMFDDTEHDQTIRSYAVDLHGVMKDAQQLRASLHSLLVEPDEGYVYWMELDTRSTRNHIFLKMVPIDIAPLLQEQFFDKKESVVLTSATLSVNDSFDYTLQRLGLDEKKTACVQYKSPFDYEKQTLLCVPKDMPDLKRGNETNFVAALIDSLTQLAYACKGRMLILFTSYQMLRQVYEPLKQRLGEEEFTVLGHGIDGNSRTKLTKQFIESPQAILLGTNSFWEGVDIPGDALSCLAIVRLPFWPPNHPIIEARNERIKQQQGNPFMELSLPQAVIRFKQGFGRLVRNQQDKGAVIIFDNRVVAARYGKYFIRSLPDIPVHHEPMDQLIPKIEDWLEP